jgi:riboflavin kinase
VVKKNRVELSDYLSILIHLGKMGAIRRPVNITTSELGEAIGVSQQSSSRKLTQMENTDLIVRTYSQGGNSIKITRKGTALLEHIFTDLWMILTAEGIDLKEKISIKGKVITGMGEGAYYMSRKGYKRQFYAILGFTPYPGTLNLQILEDQHLGNFERLLRSPAKFISEFKENNRIFGKVFVWPANLLINNKKIPSAVIRPDRTHHVNQIELIAEDHIKSKFNVKDGDDLEVILY